VQKVTTQGDLVWVIGGDGSDDGFFKSAMGMAYARGELYVADWGNNRVQVFDRDDAFLRTWGAPGDGPGQFASPVGVGVAPDGRVYVVDTRNVRVQAFTPDGEYLFEFGQSGFGPGDLRDPNRVRVLPDGTVWVSDLVQGRLSHFDANGEFIEAVPPLHLNASHGFAIAPDGRMYISDTRNGVIKVVAPVAPARP
jgi:DNA-binding beta-propeller fold protein YncE